MQDLPKSFREQYTRRDIAARVDSLGLEISEWADTVWQQSHTDLLTIPVLRGGIFFFADLVRRINRSVEISPAQTWAYDPNANNVMLDAVRVLVDEVPARGRAVLLVDDICDSGKTLRALSDTLLGAGALEVRSAVLIQRALENQAFDPHWVGFEYNGDEWFVGYGMEDCGRFRNLPDIYTIVQHDQG